MSKKCYCCNENAISREHIPPKCLFLPPRPSNMITVSSCPKHNFAKSKDDEYFRWFISTACAEFSNDAITLLKGKVSRGLRRSPGLLRMIMQGAIKEIDVYSKGGIWLDRRPGFKYNKRRIVRVLKLICKGLYFYHSNKKVINSQKFVLEFNPDLDENLKKAITTLKLNAIGDGRVFSYRYYSKSENNIDRTMWFMLFYNSFLVNCLLW